jgi:hypothetical protein
MLSYITQTPPYIALICISLGLSYYMDKYCNKEEKLPVNCTSPLLNTLEVYTKPDFPVEEHYDNSDLFNDTYKQGEKDYGVDYRHALWPSPRPVNLVKLLRKTEDIVVDGRLSHKKAIDILSSRANLTTEQFLSVHPVKYMLVHMETHNPKKALGNKLYSNYLIFQPAL